MVSIIIAAVVGAVAGYAFRGLIHREIGVVAIDTSKVASTVAKKV